MCIVEIHELNMTSISKTRTESKQTKTYNCNLGQHLLRHITKIPIFCTYPDKNPNSRKLKDSFPHHFNVVYGNRRNARSGC